MMEMDKEINKIADYYGFEAQSRQLIEELAELMLELDTYIYCCDRYNYIHLQQILGEMADVRIMLKQYTYLIQKNYPRHVFKYEDNVVYKHDLVEINKNIRNSCLRMIIVINKFCRNKNEQLISTLFDSINEIDNLIRNLRSELNIPWTEITEQEAYKVKRQLTRIGLENLEKKEETPEVIIPLKSIKTNKLDK